MNALKENIFVIYDIKSFEIRQTKIVKTTKQEKENILTRVYFFIITFNTISYLYNDFIFIIKYSTT